VSVVLKVAAYARVSTDKEDQINSLTNQREYFESYIKSNGDWEFVEVYFDEGITGTQTKKRKGFNRMINDCKNGKIDLILTKEVSRFARNTVDTLNYTRMLKEYDVGVFFINDNIDTRQNDGEFRLAIMASVAQEESRKISERVKWVLWKTVLCSEITVLSDLILMTVYCLLMTVRQKLSN
jgi:site-specific DNA recombinase